MINRILYVVAISLVLTACNTQKKADRIHSQAEPEMVTVSRILNDAADLVDQEVIITGSVTHVCRHGGQRLFIIGEDPEKTVKITTGEGIAEFDITLEGSSIRVDGIVKELIIDETYLAEWEAEVMAGTGETGQGSGERPGEHALATGVEAPEDDETTDESATQEQIQAQLDNIQSIRDEIAGSGKDHLSEYWVEAISFSVLDNTGEEE